MGPDQPGQSALGRRENPTGPATVGRAPVPPARRRGPSTTRTAAVSQSAHELQEPHPAHFLVSRRAADTGKTATFVVRVEHNRGWDSPRHSSWPTDPETGNRYQEFPLTLTGNQRQVVGRIEVLDNGIADHSLWQYSAEIKQIEDAATGTALSAHRRGPVLDGEVATGRGPFSLTSCWERLSRIKSVAPKQVPEGQAVTITLERQFGNPWRPIRSKCAPGSPTRPWPTAPTPRTRSTMWYSPPSR